MPNIHALSNQCPYIRHWISCYRCACYWISSDHLSEPLANYYLSFS